MIDTEALRKKVIELAIQGKLTQQLPEDGDAEDLYAQIQKEKARLINEGKIKKEKPLPNISDEEIPFEIPKNWKWVQLNDIGSWSAGATPSRKNKEYYSNGTIPWIKTGELNDGYIYVVEECITDKAFEESSVRLNPIGSVLIAMYGATIGKVGILGINATTNQACCACIPILIDNRFLFYFLKGNKDQFINSSHGGAQPNISKEIIVQSRFPLPPLAEQKRIVEILNDVLAQIDIIDALKQQYEFDREILKGKIIDAGIRGKITEQLPEDGNATDLYAQIQEEKTKLIRKGKIKKEKSLPDISDDEIPFETPTNWKWIRFGDLMLNRDSERIPVSVADRKRLSKNYDYYGASGVIDKVENFIFDEKLLLIGEDGANLVSRSTPIAFMATGKYWVNNHAHVLGCYKYDYLDFVMHYINAISLVPYVTGSAQPKLNQENMNKIPVPFPPITEQNRIVERINGVLRLLETPRGGSNED